MKRIAIMAVLLCGGPLSAQCVPPGGGSGGGVKSPSQIWDEKYALAKIQLQFTTAKLSEAKTALAKTDSDIAYVGGKVNERLGVMTAEHIQMCLDGLKIAAGCRAFQVTEVAEATTQNNNQSIAITAAVVAVAAGDYNGAISLLDDAGRSGELSSLASSRSRGWGDSASQTLATVLLVVWMYP